MKHQRKKEPTKPPAGASRRLRYILPAAAVLLTAVLLALRPWQPRLELPELTASSIVVLDAADGSVLYEKNPDAPRPPSSLTKLMSLYLIFGDLAGGAFSLEDAHRVAPEEANTPGSKYGLHPGMTVTVDQLLAGAILNSGCDCVQCLVSLSTGSEEAFVARMNDMAAALGLSGSHFVNAVGLDAENHYMTARDLAQLSYRLVTDYPAYVDYASQPTLALDGLSFQNLNVLVGHDPRVRGLKTGTTRIGGNNLVTYADWEGKAYLIVLLDSASVQRRFVETQTILDALYGALPNGQA